MSNMNEEQFNIERIELVGLSENRLAVVVNVFLGGNAFVTGHLWRSAFGNENRFCVTGVSCYVRQNRLVGNYEQLCNEVANSEFAREVLSAFQQQISLALSSFTVE